MIIVKRLFSDYEAVSTDVWISEKAAKKLLKQARKSHIPNFHALLKRYAATGFSTFEGSQSPIRHEGEGVYRIGNVSSLFRLYGFYDGPGKTCFIIVDAATKPDTQIDSQTKLLLRKVAKVRQYHEWRKDE